MLEINVKVRTARTVLFMLRRNYNNIACFVTRVRPEKIVHTPTLFLILLSFFLLTADLHVQAQQWPQYRGPHATGKIDNAKLDLASGKLKVHWKVEAPLGFSSLSIANGKAVTIFGRDSKEVCVALDANSGREIWAAPLGSTKYDGGGGNAGAQGNKGGDGPRSTPAISGERVYVYDAHLNLSCLNLADGSLIWRRNVEQEYGGQNIKWNNATSPLIDKDSVYVAGGGDGQSFLAFDQRSGELKWKSGTETLTHASPAFATQQGKKLIVFFVQYGLVAVDAANGDEVWRTKFPFDVSSAASPIINGSLVYCSAGYGVGAGMYDVTEGKNIKQVWRKPNRLMNHWSSPVLHDGHLYGLYRFKKYGTAPLQCVEFATGEIKWSERGFGQGNCIIVDDKVVVLTDFGDLVIVDANAEQYSELWRGKVLDGKCWSTPAFADGKIFVRSTREAVCVSFQ